MSNPRVSRLLRLATIAWFVLSIGLLIVAYTGYGSHWLIAHVWSCGHHEEGMRTCRPDEVHDAMHQVGWASLAGSVVAYGGLMFKASGLDALLKS